MILGLDYAALGQQPGTSDPPAEHQDKRIFGIISNLPNLSESCRLQTDHGAREKFVIASQDSFDRGTIVLAAAFAGTSQWTNANPSFGQGAAGFGRYFGTSYADFVIGDYMTEGIFPTILKQDPRYFRRGIGSGRSRLGYAAGQIFWTHANTGRGQFNYSEILGNSTAVAISNSYYPENRDVGDAVTKLGVQIAVDMTANILKEFWPDLDRKFFHKHPSNPAPAGGETQK